MVDPETMLFVGIIGGIGAAAAYGAYNYAEKVGPKIKAEDLLPMPPDEGPPLPRFLNLKWPGKK